MTFVVGAPLNPNKQTTNNGVLPCPQAANLRQELSRKERQLDELKQKYTKHKQILTENVQKAESEIQTLDEIIDYVIVVS